MLERLARFCSAHRWWVVGLWVALIVAINAIAGAVGPDWRTEFTLPDGEAKQVQELLMAASPDLAGFTSQLVVHADQGVDDPAVRAQFEQLIEFAAAQDGITVSSPYDQPQQVAPGGTIAFAELSAKDRPFEDLVTVGEAIRERGEALQAETPVDGLTIEYGGDLFGEFELPESEIYGVIGAIIILLLAFGSVLAMGLPIGIALFGLGCATAIVTLLSNPLTMPDFTTAMVAMIGLGVGIDYALFIVTRYREALHAGLPVRESIVEAIDTSGRAVIFAGITVVIALLGLSLMGLQFVTGIAVAAAIGVAIMVIASLTLLPALLALVGLRIDSTTRAALIAIVLFVVGLFVGVTFHAPIVIGAGVLLAIVVMAASFVGPGRSLRRLIPRRVQKPREQTFWYRWSRVIQGHPWLSMLGAVVLLVLLAIPLLSIRLGFGDYGNVPERQTVRRAYDLLAEGFGPGSNGPIIVTIEGDGAGDPSRSVAIIEALQADAGVAFVAGPNPLGESLALAVVYPTSAPQDAATAELVGRLRHETLPAAEAASDGLDAKVGGATAAAADFAGFMGGRMPLLIGVVLAMSFLLLMAVFRSVLVPLKAVVMNLLSVAAAYGVLVAVFQWGWLAGLIGVDRSGPIEAWLPMFLFAIVFGLSMDYEVFLLSRIKEEYDRSVRRGAPDNGTAVADGLALTARVITAAALIMACVFAAFVLGDERALKMFGLGLAVAVLLDATIVRMVLVPATMELLGDRNWWIPKWLDRILPKIDVEGHHREHHTTPDPNGSSPEG